MDTTHEIIKTSHTYSELQNILSEMSTDRQNSDDSEYALEDVHAVKNMLEALIDRVIDLTH